jgi:hypothetical protein
MRRAKVRKNTDPILPDKCVAMVHDMIYVEIKSAREIYPKQLPVETHGTSCDCVYLVKPLLGGTPSVWEFYKV